MAPFFFEMNFDEPISATRRIRDEQLRLLQTLKYLNTVEEGRLMVPISGLALAKGTIIKSKEIILSMGADWFVKYSNLDAQKVVQRRLDRINDSLINLQVKQEATKNLHVFGHEKNEDGENFIEIRELEDENMIHEVPALPTPMVVNHDPKIEAAYQYLMKRLDELELEEKGMNSDPKPKNIKRKSVSFSDKVEYREMSTNEPTSAASSSIPLKGSDANQFQLRDEQAEEMQTLHSPDEQKMSRPKSLKNEEIIKSKIVLKDLDDSSDENFGSDSSSDEYDPEILKNQVRIEYHKTRQRLISAGLLEPSTTEEQEMVEQASKIEKQTLEEERQVFGSTM